MIRNYKLARKPGFYHAGEPDLKAVANAGRIEPQSG
jgi:hypothetical protein